LRIEEFAILRYGPLPASGQLKPGAFALFFGNNEEGKTLTIDALVKMLLGNKTRVFEKIGRVDEFPEGYLVLRDNDGRAFKLPEKGDLTSLAGIHPSEARNVFVIRDSDLSLAAESDHYRQVTDRLTGMRTEAIAGIKRSLREIGGLTETGRFSDAGEEKLKSRLEEAGVLLEAIRSLKAEMEEAGLEEAEKSLAGISEKMEKTEREIHRLETAEKRQKYEKGRQALDRLQTLLGKLEGLHRLSREDERLWGEHEHDIRREEERKKRTIQALERKIADAEDLGSRHRRLEQEIAVLEKTSDRIQDDLRDLREYEIRIGELEKKRGTARFYTAGAVFFAVLSVLSLAGFIIRPGLKLFPFLFSLFLAGGGIFAGLRFDLARKEAWQRGIFRRARLNLAKHGLSGDSIEELFAAVQAFEDRLDARKREMERLSEEKGLAEAEIRKLREEEIPESEERIHKARTEITGIRKKTGAGTLQELRQKLEEREQKENLRDRQMETLTTLFPHVQRTEEVKISAWQHELERLLPYREKALDVFFNEAEMDRLKAEMEILAEKLEAEKEKIRLFRDKLADVGRRANHVLRPEKGEHLPCGTSVDLHSIEEKIEAFVADHEKRKADVEAALEILEEIESEEEEKVAGLFGAESPVSAYFGRITGGLYTEVLFDSSSRSVLVKNREGNLLGVETLSGGTYDQLYLSVRLGLGEKLLGGRPGFFIMDDPFVKADRERLAKQVDLLRHIRDRGWQILYFSAKEEVKQALEDDIRSGKVNLIPVGMKKKKDSRPRPS